MLLCAGGGALRCRPRACGAGRGGGGHTHRPVHVWPHATVRGGWHGLACHCDKVPVWAVTQPEEVAGSSPGNCLWAQLHQLSHVHVCPARSSYGWCLHRHVQAQSNGLQLCISPCAGVHLVPALLMHGHEAENNECPYAVCSDHVAMCSLCWVLWDVLV